MSGTSIIAKISMSLRLDCTVIPDNTFEMVINMQILYHNWYSIKIKLY